MPTKGASEKKNTGLPSVASVLMQGSQREWMSVFTHRSHENLYPLIKCNTNANVCVCVCARCVNVYVSVCVHRQSRLMSLIVTGINWTASGMNHTSWRRERGKRRENFLGPLRVSIQLLLRINECPFSCPDSWALLITTATMKEGKGSTLKYHY